jgi:hypothetical protein
MKLQSLILSESLYQNPWLFPWALGICDLLGYRSLGFLSGLVRLSQVHG